jgi:hypothetical protein
VTEHDAIFREEVFAEPTGWTAWHTGPDMIQRYKILRRNAMYTETRLVIAAPVDAIVAKLRGDWEWWRNGRYRNRVERPDGMVEYDHYPMSNMVHVKSLMYPPMPLGSNGRRIRIEISDYMTGTLYMDVVGRPDGTSELCSRFAAVQVTGPFRFLPYPGHIAAMIHLSAERGTFVWPKGTGFGGLIDELTGAGRGAQASLHTPIQTGAST